MDFKDLGPTSRRLAQALIIDEVLSAADVESVLQRQVVLGGSLDTNLLEANLLSEEQVLAALAAAFNLPSAARGDIDGIGAHIPRLLPLVFAETYHLVPFRLVEQQLHVLVNGLPDAQLTERIYQRLQLVVSPVVTTEVRLHYAMHRLYGTELLPRYNALLARLDGTPPLNDAVAPISSGEHMLSWGVSSSRISAARGSSGKLSGQDVRTMVARMGAASDRDTIVEILLGFALAVFEFTGLFLVQGDAIHGWRSTNAESTRRIAQISLPLTVPSVLQTIYTTAGHYLGPLPAHAVNTKLLADMGRTPPRAAFLAPISVGGKLVAIIYADNGAKPVSPKRVAALLVLVQRTGIGLENIIRQRKRDVAQLMGKSAEPQADPPAVSSRTTPDGGDGELDFSDITDARELPTPPVAAQLDRPIGVALAPGAAPIPLPLDGFAGIDIEVDLGDTESPADSIATVSAAPKPESPEHPKRLAEDESLYVAFADVDDSPQESLGEWEDVMLDVVSDATKAALGGKTSRQAPLAVTWEDVILEAQAAARIVPVLARTVQMAGTVVDERDIWFDGLDADDPEARRAAIAKLLPLGNSIDDELARRFPGRVRFDPMGGNRPPPFADCSGVTELLAARGADAASVILPQLESDEPRRRFFAIYFLLSVHVPDACEALARRLYDSEPRLRFLAVEALRRYSSEPAYRRIVQGLREQLRLGAPENQTAVLQILGQLREPSAVPALIPLVSINNPEVARAAASALAVISAQAFGNDMNSWLNWWQGNANKPRALWLLSGLGHDNPTIRRVAHTELQHLTGQVVPFDPDASETDRQQAAAAWQQWLQNASAAGRRP